MIQLDKIPYFSNGLASTKLVKVREGYSVFVVRGAFPKPGAPEVILQIRSHDTKSNANRCDLEQDHKKLLEAIQGGERALTVAVLENFWRLWHPNFSLLLLC